MEAKEFKEKRAKVDHEEKSADPAPEAISPPMDPDVPAHIQHLLNNNYHHLDPEMPRYVQLLADLGANQCWHKHGTFGEHLTGVWKILQAWKMPQAITRMGLFHSTYSNSWVGLALLKPYADRAFLKSVIGEEAEQLVHLMCSVPRMELTFQQILKLERIPEEGIVTKDIRSGEPLPLTRRELAIYLAFHVADWAEQFSSWQDRLFRNEEKGDMETPFRKILDKSFVENPGTLWPGDGRPGIYLNALSRYCKYIRECGEADLIPPIFENCTKILAPEDEKKARDLYWRVVTTFMEVSHAADAIDTLEHAIALNPYVGEPHVLLAQCHAREGKYDLAVVEAKEAIRLLFAWGVNWDKRVCWGGWVAWARVLLRHSLKRDWPKSSMGIINLGLVQDK